RAEAKPVAFALVEIGHHVGLAGHAVAVAEHEDVTAVAPRQHVRPLATEQSVIAGAAEQLVVADTARNPVRPVAAVERVTPFSAAQEVVAAEAEKRVVSPGTDDVIVQPVAGTGARATDEPEHLDAVHQRVIDLRNRAIAAAPVGFDNEIVEVEDPEGVVAIAADQRVGTAPTLQPVVSAAAEELVIAL